MEAAGVGIGVAGLASLLGTVRDIHGVVNSYREFDFESRPHFVQRDAARASYQQWSESVGYDQGELKDDHHKALDNPAVLSIVREIEQCIREIDVDAGNDPLYISSQPRPAGPASRDPLSRTKKSMQLERFRGSASRRTKLAWALIGKEKISDQTELVAALLQCLRELVPPQQPSDTGRTQIGPESHAIDALSLRLQQAIRMIEDNEEKRINGDFKRNLASWLGTTWTTTMYDTFVQRRLSGTCDWILERSEFRNWEATDFDTAKVLWIHGPAGYGKTILCARVVEHLAARFPLAYYFFSSDSDSRADPFTIIRSWISQIISQNQRAFELARGRWEATDGRPATQMEVVELLILVAQNTPNCFFIVDGLDECAGTGYDWQNRYRNSLLGFFRSLKQAISNTKSRLLVVSRNEPDIRDGLRIEISGTAWDLVEYCVGPDDVKPDATIFSQSIVDRKLGNKSEAQREELAHRMVDRYESMFLCIKMLEGQLRGGKGWRQLQQAVDQAPNLGNLYDQNWRRIMELPDADRNQAMAIIRWATFALRPLTILELASALLLADEECHDVTNKLPDAIDDEYIATEILNLCGSLIETRGTSSNPSALTIHLPHFSVKQYLLCHMPTLGGQLSINEQLQYSNEKKECNILAITCLRYLSYDEVWIETQPKETGHIIQAFQRYATDSWYRHFKQGAPNSTEVVEQANRFFHPSCNNWDAWRKLADAALQNQMLRYQGSIQSGNRLFYASVLGLLETMIHLIEKAGLDVNYVDASGRTALLAASSTGWESGVTRLLEKGANVNTASNEGRTPIYVAASNGHGEVVKLLLEKGADLTVASNDGQTPLNSASDSGHLEVVKLLLEKGADLTIADIDGWTPLYLASDSGHLEVVKLLLEKGADLTIVDIDGWTPLISASHSGHSKVVRLLLEKGADLTLTNNNGWTPLTLASESGHLEVVRLLLEKGADLTVTNNNGWTPLNSASDSGHLEVVRLLLEKGANFTVADNNGWTPLNSASDSGHLEVVRLLLEKGADATVADNDGWTPLMVACRRGKGDVVKLLLSHQNVEPWSGDNKGRTALSWASLEGYKGVVELLLADERIDKNLRDGDGLTPLMCAVRNRHESTARLLVRHGCKVCDLDEDCFVFHAALSMSDVGFQEVMGVLNLENSEDFFGLVALYGSYN